LGAGLKIQPCKNVIVKKPQKGGGQGPTWAVEPYDDDADDIINMMMMMEAVSTSETSVDNYFTRQYIPEDNSELHTRRRENFKSHNINFNSNF
jgi:hypothetical protein